MVFSFRPGVTAGQPISPWWLNRGVSILPAYGKVANGVRNYIADGMRAGGAKKGRWEGLTWFWQLGCGQVRGAGTFFRGTKTRFGVMVRFRLPAG